MVFALGVRLSKLLGGDIDREYCLRMWDEGKAYSQTAEPDLLANYTKVSPFLCALSHSEYASFP